jgi:1-deoxy-D-xylulose-5-phosphate synthase
LNYDELKKLSDKKFFDSLTIEDLNNYAELLRKYIVKICSKKSTHLASNLGTVEIFLALNKVFDFTNDLFTFDVGHQIYTYKILTGRFDRFPTIREFNGLSGFPDPEESDFDLFKVGHVGCGLPLALGLSAGLNKEESNKVEDKNIEKDESKNKKKTERQIVTLLGDGALTNGPMLEALNYIANRKNGKIIIILNDNGMSISRTVPSITKKLSLFATKLNIRGSLEQKLKKKGHSVIIESLVKFFRSMKNFILPKQIFEDFGIRYVGPIDGHNIKELIEYFSFAKNFPHTILIHVKTIKGKGFKPAEENPELFHSAPPFNPLTGEVKLSTNTFTNLFGRIIVEKARENKDIYAITAAMKNGCGLDSFEKEYPDRFIDVGIAESLAVSMAAGLAKIGKKPVVCIYSIFLLRAASQVYHDVVLNHLPVFFAIDRSGLVGIDGPTHHGLYIYPFLCGLPDINLFNCGFIEDVESAFSILGNAKLPVFIQYPKDVANSFYDEIKKMSYEIGDDLKVEYKPFDINKIYGHNESKIAVISVGSSFSICKNAFIKLFKEKIYFNFYYISQVKPFNDSNVNEILSNNQKIIVVDESPSSSYIYQRFNEISSKVKMENNLKINILPFILPEILITHGTREQLFDLIGFSSKELVNLIKRLEK